MNRTLLIRLLLFTGRSSAADLLEYTRDGNRVRMRLSDGECELDWIAPSSFRFRRAWAAGLQAVPDAPGKEPVKLEVQATPTTLLLASEDLRVQIYKRGLRLVIETAADGRLLQESTEAQRDSNSVVLERDAPAGTRYYGLGPRTASSLDARGMRIRTATPFLISSAGYGEYHSPPGTWTFDMAASRTDRYRIEATGATQIDYYFYNGPSPKDILEEHLRVTGSIPPISIARLRSSSRSMMPADAWYPPPPRPSWVGLQEYLHLYTHASLSGILLPVWDVEAFQEAFTVLAAQVGSIVPLAVGAVRDQRFLPYLLTYADEARDRGYPIVRPLPLQFPRDLEAHRHADEFMLGDELLIVPAFTPDRTRSVYLPQGVWTDLRTDAMYKGRQTIQITAAEDELPMFARNGTIVPLETAPDEMLLHYFPRLAAEFFIYEHESGQYSQAHAAPAADDLRFQIESKVARTYIWVVHHTPEPTRVVSAGHAFERVSMRDRVSPDSWFWDKARQQLWISVRVAQDEDSITNVSF